MAPWSAKPMNTWPVVAQIRPPLPPNRPPPAPLVFGAAKVMPGLTPLIVTSNRDWPLNARLPLVKQKPPDELNEVAIRFAGPVSWMRALPKVSATSKSVGSQVAKLPSPPPAAAGTLPPSWAFQPAPLVHVMGSNPVDGAGHVTSRERSGVAVADQLGDPE